MADFNNTNLADFSGVWVFCEQRQGELQPTVLELISEARKLADDMGTEVCGLLLGGKGVGEKMAKELGAYGADKVLVCESDLLDTYTTDAYAKVLCDTVMAKKPEILLIAATNIGRDLGPRCAARLHTGLTADCTHLDVDVEKYTAFLQDELVAVVHMRSKLAVADEILPEELPNIPLVLRERGSGTLDVFERALLQYNLKLSSLNVLMYLGSTESIKLFLEHTDCMGIVSIRSVHKELVVGTLRVVEIKGMPMQREFNFVQLQGQEGGLSQVFMRFAGHHSKSL